MGRATIGSISIVIGLTSWFGIAKIIRTEVRQLRSSEYVVAAKCREKFLAYFMETSGTEFCVINYVYGGNECRSAIVAESTLSFGHWIAAGCDFLGQYAVSGRKSTDVESLVDRSDSGNFSGGRIDVYYQSGALASGESQPSGSKIITPSICDGKRMIEILQ